MTNSLLDRRRPSTPPPVTEEDLDTVRQALTGTDRFNRRSARAIAFVTGLTTRHVRRVIRELNLRGEPVVGYPERGFWLAEHQNDMFEYADSLKDQADALLTRAVAAQAIGFKLAAQRRGTF